MTLHAQFAHPAVAFVLTPEGRISRYLYGVDFPGRELRLSWSRRATAASGPASTACCSSASGTTPDRPLSRVRDQLRPRRSAPLRPGLVVGLALLWRQE